MVRGFNLHTTTIGSIMKYKSLIRIVIEDDTKTKKFILCHRWKCFAGSRSRPLPSALCASCRRSRSRLGARLERRPRSARSALSCCRTRGTKPWRCPAWAEAGFELWGIWNRFFPTKARIVSTWTSMLPQQVNYLHT